jgi:hypothetical protein
MKYNLGATFAAAKFEQGNKYSYEDVLDIFVSCSNSLTTT